MVTVNMFETVFNQVTWDCHGTRPFSTLDDYASELLPTFDRALSALLDDLDRRGLLETTLVVATGEFGRTPRLNYSGGRDHWPGVWSASGRRRHAPRRRSSAPSDPHAAGPADRPVTPRRSSPRCTTAWASTRTSRLTLADGSPAPRDRGAGADQGSSIGPRRRCRSVSPTA